MKKYNYTYITVNNLNNKVYVGVHSTDDLDDGYMGSGVVLKRAFKKYGKENFSTLKIKFYSTIEDAYEAEKCLVNPIWVQDSTTYNLVKGGVGNYNHTEDAKIRIGKAAKKNMTGRKKK
ncbi:GIY-YIG nuclease family protein [Bizionia psychrotolerans]|uniref:GIY-YIG nuclease family protein n=1 Tax=Bizionia psychrotolerans TaxID=1492901 RepID=UPI00069FB603|nr:GIY-YIG nuclease family protein [Bizionia psychrotolerans]